jgi:hypothetical protein
LLDRTVMELLWTLQSIQYIQLQELLSPASGAMGLENTLQAQQHTRCDGRKQNDTGTLGERVSTLQ